MQINSGNCFKFIDTGTLLKTFMVIITAPASINFTTCKLDHLNKTNLTVTVGTYHYTKLTAQRTRDQPLKNGMTYSD